MAKIVYQRFSVINKVFQNQTSQIKSVFVNEQDLFGMTIVQFQIENCIMYML